MTIDIRDLVEAALEDRIDLLAHREMNPEERAQCLADVLFIDDAELGDVLEHSYSDYLKVKAAMVAAVKASGKQDRDCALAFTQLGALVTDMARAWAAKHLDQRIEEARCREEFEDCAPLASFPSIYPADKLHGDELEVTA